MIDLTVADNVATIVLNAAGEAQMLSTSGRWPSWMPPTRPAEVAGVRALVLRGEGRAFCAGRDISGVDPRNDDVLGVPRRARHPAASSGWRGSLRRPSRSRTALASGSGSDC